MSIYLLGGRYRGVIAIDSCDFDGRAEHSTHGSKGFLCSPAVFQSRKCEPRCSLIGGSWVSEILS